MLTNSLKFNQKLIKDSMLYRYPLFDAEGEGIDMTWCVYIDDDKIERKGDTYPVYEVPEGRLVLLDDLMWWPSWASTETFVGGSLGRNTVEGEYQIVLNVSAHSMQMVHVPLARPLPFFSGEWICVCPHLIGKAERTAFRMTLRFREIPAPESARRGKQVRYTPSD